MTKYISNAGLDSTRDAVAEMYTNRGAPTQRNQVLVTHGSMFAMATSFMAAIDPDDEVLLPDPGFPNYYMSVKLTHGTPVPYTLDVNNDWLPDLGSLERSLTEKTKMIVINSPSNPTGQVFS